MGESSDHDAVNGTGRKITNLQSPNEVRWFSRYDKSSTGRRQSKSQMQLVKSHSKHIGCRRHQFAARGRHWSWQSDQQVGNRLWRMGSLIFSIVAVVEKSTVLAETAVRLNPIDHNARLNGNFGINSTVCLGDKACIRGQQG